MRFLILFLFSLPAHAPVVEWRLVPTGFEEINLCLKPCVLKAYWVVGYRWVPT